MTSNTDNHRTILQHAPTTEPETNPWTAPNHETPNAWRAATNHLLNNLLRDNLVNTGNLQAILNQVGITHTINETTGITITIDSLTTAWDTGDDHVLQSWLTALNLTIGKIMELPYNGPANWENISEDPNFTAAMEPFTYQHTANATVSIALTAAFEMEVDYSTNIDDLADQGEEEAHLLQSWDREVYIDYGCHVVEIDGLTLANQP